MVNAMIGEIEELAVRLARGRTPAVVEVDAVAKAYSKVDWRQFVPLVREAAWLLQRRGLGRLAADRVSFEYTGA